MSGVALTLLGGFSARGRAGDVPVLIGRRKAEALLAYLACHPGSVQLRDKLASLLWPETTDGSARHSLRQALVTLRRALPPGVLRMDETALGLDERLVDVDVVAFERLAAEASPTARERAAALYKGDFLAGLVIEAPPFEEWLRAERERLRELAVDTFARLLAHQRDANDLPAALQTALQLLALDPLQEAVHRAVMRLQAARGRRDAALRQYQTCVDVLQRELGIEPEADTKALYREILRHRGRPSAPPEERGEASAPAVDARFDSPERVTAIVGRHAELARLGRALEDSHVAGGRLVAVLGEAGIGKSRLLAEIASRARGHGARVLLGRSYQSAMIMPFGPWVDALRNGGAIGEAMRGLDPVWRRELARLFPELAEAGHEPAASSEDAGRLFESIARLLDHLAARQPLVVMLEDIHWADGMTIRLLASLARRSAGAPCVLVASARDDELAEALLLQDVLGELAAAGRLDRLALTALSRTETAELVHVLARRGSDAASTAPLADRVWALSHGNPFMIVETMAALEQGSPLTSPSGLDLPKRVRDVIARRLDRLTPLGRSLVAVAAVIGREFEFPLLRHSAAMEEGEVAEGLEELVRRRILRVSDERFDFTHDRIREVVAAQLLPPRRRLLHRQVADALEMVATDDLDRDWSTLGTHCREAGLWDKAARCFREAGKKASRRSANREAAACFEQAVAALRRLPRSVETLTTAVDLHLELRNALLLLGELPRVGECLAGAEDAARELGDPRRLAWVLLSARQYRWWVDESGNARVFAEQAEAAGEGLGDASLTVTGTVYAGMAWYQAGDYRRGKRSQSELLERLEAEAPGGRHGHHSFPLPVAHSHMARCCGELGEFVEGVAHGREVLRIAEAIGHKYSLMMGCWCLGDLYRLQGNHDEAIALLERAVALVRDRRLSPQIVGTLGHAYVIAGRLGEGLKLLEEERAAMESSGWYLYKSRLLEHLGEAYLLAGRPVDALVFTDQALDLARKRGERGFEAWALRLGAEIQARSEPFAPVPAERAYRLALHLAEELGMRPLAAHCHMGLVRLLRRADRPEADEHLSRADVMYRQMGMRPASVLTAAPSAL